MPSSPRCSQKAGELWVVLQSPKQVVRDGRNRIVAAELRVQRLSHPRPPYIVRSILSPISSPDYGRTSCNPRGSRSEKSYQVLVRRAAHPASTEGKKLIRH